MTQSCIMEKIGPRLQGIQDGEHLCQGMNGHLKLHRLIPTQVAG